MAEGKKSSPKCVLDKNGCLSLDIILESFNAPINEEQAWAVCHQCLKYLSKQWEISRPNCFRLNGPKSIKMCKDGDISISADSEVAERESQLLSSLGLALFIALDYGLTQEEERKLSQPLENLLDQMTSADEANEQNNLHYTDEGIEDLPYEDGCHTNKSLLQHFIDICTSHFTMPSQADLHYKAVCRALVAETMELSSFLEKISSGTQELWKTTDVADKRNLENLKFHDWARLWMQVIRDLRQGVKLKKVHIESNSVPIEFELTPYEILMDDIRSRRYKLNKIMINGDIPHRVKKDAHAVILEFIRSRPPLRHVDISQLPKPPQREKNAFELLLDSIRQHPQLRPTSKSSSPVMVETSRTKLNESDVTPTPRRRLIKADLTQLLSNSFDEDENDDLSSPTNENRRASELSNGTTNSLRSTKSSWKRAVALDLARQPLEFKPERRHSITVCESPVSPSGKGLEVYEFPSPSEHSAQSRNTQLSEKWKNPLECLSLTLEEFVHIRSVLTKAEMEGLLGVNPELYNDLLKCKVCFTCKKTRFSFFGKWGIKCKLCQRTVCVNCCKKMSIPTEHFKNVPVYTLSPSSSGTSDEDDTPTNSFLHIPDIPGFNLSSVGSAPSSPMNTTKVQHSSSMYSLKLPLTDKPNGKSRPQLLRAHTLQKPEIPRLQGTDMEICKDCKEMVCHIILVSRKIDSFAQKQNKNPAATKRTTWQQAHQSTILTATSMPSRNLSLNLNPYYK